MFKDCSAVGCLKEPQQNFSKLKKLIIIFNMTIIPTPIKYIFSCYFGYSENGGITGL